MVKVFVSQPMNGRSDEEILKERERAKRIIEKFCDEPVEIINSFFQDVPDDVELLWYLGKSLQLMSEADLVYFVDGWHEARGCTIEYACANAYDLNVCEESLENQHIEVDSVTLGVS